MRKKIVALVICIIVVIGAVSGVIIGRKAFAKTARTVSAEKSGAVKDTDPVFYTAHKGLSGIAPENTLPAIEKAGEAGYYACEFDIYPTKDGVWVLMHDETIDRTATGKGKIGDYTYYELLEFNIKYGKNIEDYPNLKIPTLEQALDICERYNMRPMIEIKGGSEEHKKKLWEILEERDLTDKAILISFSYSTLELMRSFSENAELWLLVNDIKEDTAEKAKKLNAKVGFNGEKPKNLNMIAQLLDSNITPAAWTIDDIKLHDRLYELGVRYITTNKITPPEKAKA